MPRCASGSIGHAVLKYFRENDVPDHNVMSSTSGYPGSCAGSFPCCGDPAGHSNAVL
jgi:hypothetical protein